MKYAPILVPLILALGVIAVTIYRPPTAPGHPANRTTSSADCGGAQSTWATQHLFEKAQSAATKSFKSTF